MCTACSKPRPPDQAPSNKRPESFAGSGHLLTAPTVESTCVTANSTGFAILFVAANNQLQCPSAEDDVLSSAGREQIAADEDEREQHQVKLLLCWIDLLHVLLRHALALHFDVGELSLDLTKIRSS